MGKYGTANGKVCGRLVAVPKLETTESNFEFAKAEFEVIKRNNKTKEEKTIIIPITFLNYDAKAITNTRFVKAGSYFTIEYNIQTREYKDRNGSTQFFIELVASQIFGG